jgi:hypothetical protein
MPHNQLSAACSPHSNLARTRTASIIHDTHTACVIHRTLTVPKLSRRLQRRSQLRAVAALLVLLLVLVVVGIVGVEVNTVLLRALGRKWGRWGGLVPCLHTCTPPSLAWQCCGLGAF